MKGRSLRTASFLFTSSGVFSYLFIFLSFFQLVLFQELATSSAGGGGHDRLFLLDFAFIFFIFSFDLSTLFLFSL